MGNRRGGKGLSTTWKSNVESARNKPITKIKQRISLYPEPSRLWGRQVLRWEVSAKDVLVFGNNLKWPLRKSTFK